MSYDHIKVSAAEVHHRVVLEEIDKSAVGGTVEFGKNPTIQHKANIEGDMLVERNLYLFMQELKKSFRGVKFYAKNCRYLETLNFTFRAVSQVYVAYPNDEYCLGWVAYGAFQKSTSNNIYVVSARGIKNNKYSPNSEYYHKVMSSDLQKAVKNAKTFFRPYNSKDYITFEFDAAKNFANKILQDKRKETSNCETAITYPTSVVMEELRILYENGHQFSNSKLKSQVAAWITAKDEYEKEQARKVPMYYVYVRPQVGASETQQIDICKVDNMRSWGKSDLDRLVINTLSVDDINPYILGKLSVLSLLEDGTYEDGVGYRISERVYWVEIGEDNAES